MTRTIRAHSPAPAAYRRASDAQRRAVLSAFVLAVGVIYVLSAQTYGRSVRSTGTPSGFQALVAEAFLDGRVDLGPAPDGLEELADPYDPVQNDAFRAAGYHDLALYDGKMHSITGPTPVVLFNIPYRLLGFGYLNANLATLVYCSLGFLASVGVLAEWRRRFAPAMSLSVEAIAVVALGLATPVPWLVSIGRSYEAAIACGYMLTFAAGYFLMRGLRNVARPTWQAVLGSTCAAAAVGARPHLLILAAFVALGCLLVARAAPDRTSAALRVAPILAPYAIIGMLLGLYNYARFGSFADFGNSFQLAGMNRQQYESYKASYLLPNVYDYLVSLPRFESEWPYVHLRLSTFTGNPYVHSYEPVAGALWFFPVIVVGLVLTAAVRLWRRARQAVLLALVALAVGLGCLVAVSLPFNASTMRYAIDFTPMLVAGATLLSAGAATLVVTRQTRRIVTSVWVAAVVWSAIVGVLLVQTPCPGTGSC
jgi:hypothetical protein